MIPEVRIAVLNRPQKILNGLLPTVCTIERSSVFGGALSSNPLDARRLLSGLRIGVGAFSRRKSLIAGIDVSQQCEIVQKTPRDQAQ